MLNKGQHGDPFAVTATHATLASASQTGVSGKVHYITDIAASSDKAGSIILVKQGTTVIWQLQLMQTAAGIQAFSHSFAVPLAGAAGALVSVEVDSTAASKANIAGFTL